MKVSATFNGGYSATVDVRGHTIAVDEPEPMGENTGSMPTELVAAGLASCFALALGHVARGKGEELPGLTVEVEAERAGRELRYGRMLVTARADVPLDPYMARARRLCWVSNTFAAPPDIEYRTEDS
ncbi:OsmC family protein [Solirubrobacter soli]|uniref:OsmC family protein n=1 Tax=Solirubrobacter soli TaxID=363832 RepID=UPI0003FF3025|nr:OsmC family protein [Solirubrobacter soli]